MSRSPHRARLEYHRSHLLYYRKHNGLAARVGLRLLLGGRALVGLLAPAPSRREESRALLALALGGP